MQTPYSTPITTGTFFSRERRRQRMRQFLEAFERRSRRCAQDFPFLLPLPKDDLRQPVLARIDDSRRD